MEERLDNIVYPGSESYSNQDRSRLGDIKLMLAEEPLVKADDIAYLIFEKPDLDRQQSFLEDFGFNVAKKNDDVLYMKGFGTSPYFYVAHRGSASRFLGSAYVVKTQAALEKLAEATGSTIESVDGPGGGQKVRLLDPSGFIVDVIFGRTEVEPIETRREALPANTPWQKNRINQCQRPVLEPSPIQRLGHVVMMSADFMGTAGWYMKHLGLIPTDVQCTPDGTPALAFMRLDRGHEPADHHTVVIGQGPEAQYLHSAYETLDQDSIGQGQQYLRWRGWQHFWGIGRHILGSQIFDYWLDPYGHEMEHYADGDMFDASYPTQYHLLDRGGLWQWGDDLPDAIRPKPTLRDMIALAKGWLNKTIDFALLGQLKKAMDRKPRPWLK